MFRPSRIATTLMFGLPLVLTGTSLFSSKSAPVATVARTANDSPADFNGKGELLRPTDYRSWYFMGAPLTPNDMNNGKAAFPEFHHVYIDPAGYEHYKWTGDFRDGTVIVKELVAVGSKAGPSGKGYFAGEIIGVEAMVKDSARFSDSPGNWGFFRFTDEGAAAEGRLGRLKRTAPNVASSCVGCHAAGQHDRVFMQYYPTLRNARGAKRNPEND